MQEPHSLPGFTWGFLERAVSFAGIAQLTASSWGISYKGGERESREVWGHDKTREWFAIGRHTSHTFSSSEQIPTSSGTWIPVFLALSLHWLRGEKVIGDKKSAIFVWPKPCSAHQNNRKCISVVSGCTFWSPSALPQERTGIAGPYPSGIILTTHPASAVEACIWLTLTTLDIWVPPPMHS